MGGAAALANRRGRPRAAVRAALCALLMLTAAPGRGGDEGSAGVWGRPGEKDLERAERILARLAALGRAYPFPDGPDSLDLLHRKFYPGLFVGVAELRASELKTELDTAVYLYDLAERARRAGAREVDCGAQRSDTYAPLCRGLRRANTVELSLAKARLHARWAGALLAHHRGRADRAADALLATLARAREYDYVIAADALDDCRRLGGLLSGRAGGGGEASRTLLAARGDGGAGAAEAGSLLRDAHRRAASLPRGPVRYRLEDALGAYRDGLYWLDHLEQSTSRVVSADALNFNPLASLRVPPESARATVAANFARGRDAAAQADAALSDLKRAATRLRASRFASN